MVTSVEVFNKIKEMSKRTFGSRPRISLTDIAADLPVSPDQLLVLLKELENRRLIDIHKAQVTTVSLTSYGVNEENPTGGLRSE